MAEQLKKTTITTRIIWILLGLFFVTTVVSQLYIYLYNPLRLEIAQIYTSTESILFSGVYARNERVVSYQGTDIVAYSHTDGSKLARNSIVAQSYNSKNDISIQKQIDLLNNQIKILKDAEALENTDNSQLESFNNQINNKHSQLILAINQGDYTGVSELKNELLALQCKKLIIRGTISNYGEKISLIENEVTALNLQITSNPVPVSMMDESGYFVSAVDGYEKRINFENITDLKKSEIEEIIKNPIADTSENVIGKIVDDYKWRLAAVLDTEKTRSIFEGSTVKMLVGASSQVINATVYSVEKQDDGTSIYVFECDILSSEYVNRRVAQFRLLLNDYKGIRIKASAVRFIDGEQGVYIKSGDEVLFKKIKVIKYEEDYVLTEDTSELDGYISLYDNIIVSGLDLYEGKIVL